MTISLDITVTLIGELGSVFDFRHKVNYHINSS